MQELNLFGGNSGVYFGEVKVELKVYEVEITKYWGIW